MPLFYEYIKVNSIIQYNWIINNYKCTFFREGLIVVSSFCTRGGRKMKRDDCTKRYMYYYWVIPQAEYCTEGSVHLVEYCTEGSVCLVMSFHDNSSPTEEYVYALSNDHPRKGKRRSVMEEGEEEECQGGRVRGGVSGRKGKRRSVREGG